VLRTGRQLAAVDMGLGLSIGLGVAALTTFDAHGGETDIAYPHRHARR
jgi:hypothetical protein